MKSNKENLVCFAQCAVDQSVAHLEAAEHREALDRLEREAAREDARQREPHAPTRREGRGTHECEGALYCTSGE